jgi:hypothetical protein
MRTTWFGRPSASGSSRGSGMGYPDLCRSTSTATPRKPSARSRSLGDISSLSSDRGRRATPLRREQGGRRSRPPRTWRPAAATRASPFQAARGVSSRLAGTPSIPRVHRVRIFTTARTRRRLRALRDASEPSTSKRTVTAGSREPRAAVCRHRERGSRTRAKRRVRESAGEARGSVPGGIEGRGRLWEARRRKHRGSERRERPRRAASRATVAGRGLRKSWEWSCRHARRVFPQKRRSQTRTTNP